MSDFFTPPPPEREPEPAPVHPVWMGPPTNELGVPVPVRLLLARTAGVAVALLDVSAYSTGLEFRLEVRLREHDPLSDPFGMQARVQHRRGEVPDEVLRFGFEFPDGRRVTNLGQFPSFEEEREAPVLLQRGGGGGGHSWSFGYWLWPLPPPGELTVAVEWPARGIALTRFPIEATPLLDAAAASEPLWPDTGPDSGGGVISQLSRS